MTLRSIANPERRHVLKVLGGGAAAIGFGTSLSRAEQFSPPLGSPPDVGRKFEADGRVRQFKGNTVICHLDQQGSNGHLFHALLDIYREAPALKFMRNVTLLPPSSYHMTIFGCANDQDRVAGLWPQDVPLDFSMEACNFIIGERLKTRSWNCGLPIRMRVDLAEPQQDERPFTLRLLPVDQQEDHKLRQLRNRLSDVTGIRSPRHDSYGFHVTLGYLIRWLSPAENEEFRHAYRRWHKTVAAKVPIIELGTPEYCVLDDMFAFRRDCYLPS